MAEVDITWISEKRFLAVDSTNHTVVLSPANDIGAKPSDVFLIALAACGSVDVVEIIKKRRAELHRYAVHVTADQLSEPPWTFLRIHLHFDVTATGLRQEHLERAVDLALNKYCSVRSSLSPDVTVAYDVALHTPESGDDGTQIPQMGR